MLPLEKRDWKQITLVRNCFFFLEQLFASMQSCWGLVSFTSLSSEFSSDWLMYDIDWLTDRRTNGQTDRLPNELSVCLTYCLSHRLNDRPIDWKIEALTGRGMSESLQTCSITRSSWSSSFCSPDYDETHTHKIKTIKKILNFSVLNCHPFSVPSQLFFLLGLSFSLPLFFLTELIFCGHLQSILIFPF